VNKSESISALAKALATAQSSLKNTPASKDNPHFKSKYTPLDDLLDMARSVLPTHGLSVLQNVSGASDTVSIVTMIMHESGEWIESDPLTMKTEKNTPQGQGSAITYGRRYSLSAILGIATDPDDDGSEAEKPKALPKTTPPAPKEVFPTDGDALIGPQDYKTLVMLCADDTGRALDLDKQEMLMAILKDNGYGHAKEIKIRDYQKIYRLLELSQMPDSLGGNQ